CARSWFAYW
nr:immunoglobulin heavy chain junction region [Mus musculus]